MIVTKKEYEKEVARLRKEVSECKKCEVEIALLNIRCDYHTNVEKYIKENIQVKE